MREVLNLLWQLQQTDVEIGALERRRKELSESTRAADEALEVARAAQTLAHEATQESLAAVHRREMDLQEREEQIDKIKVAMNAASSNKEYQGMLLKIGTLEAENGKIEDEILLAMEEQEGKESEEHKAKEGTSEAEAGLRAAEAAVEAASGDFDREQGQLEGRRGEISGSVPEEQLKLYERIRKGNRSSGTAVVEVHGEWCQGCQMTITPQQYSDLVGGKTLVLCRSCQRILVMAES